MRMRCLWSVTAVALVAAVIVPAWVEAQRGDGAAPGGRAGGRGARAGAAGRAGAAAGQRQARPERPLGQPLHAQHGAARRRSEDARAAEVRAPGRGAFPARWRRRPAPAARTFDLPFTEWGLKQWKDYDPVNKGDYAGNCLPFGMSRNINSPHGVQILHHPDALAFLFEQNTWHHWVPTNASFKWPADLPETWNGIVDGPLGRRHAGHRDQRLQRLHQAGHGRPSAQQGAEAHQHVPAHRLAAR